MEIYAKGQLSYLILNCLQERDFYGLDIITEIKERSGGRILLKKPSVYSNLNRMEKQGQVSSYVQSSDLGPNRRYYSITEKGRNTYQELKNYFDSNRIDVFKDFVGDESVMQPQPTQEQEELQTESNDDFFDFSSLEEPKAQPAQELNEEKVDDGKFLTEEPQEPVAQEVKKYSIASLLRPEVEPQAQEPVAQTQAEEPAPAPQQEQEKVLSNQEIYDISKDINRNRRRRSFADDQMAFAVSEPEEANDERAKQNLEELKSSLLASKGKTNERMSEDEFYGRRSTITPAPEKPVEKAQNSYAQNLSSDDGVFITGQVEEQTARARKIEPPRLKIISEKEPLPAPKKDSSIDLSHKEIISRLYSKSKGSQNSETDAAQNYIYDYDDLQDYYQTQGVSFRIYEKSKTQENHNTNKLNFFTSLICFALSLVCSALFFTIFYLTGNTNNVTDFLYIALPLIAGAETVYRYYAYKNYTSWEPKPLKSQILIWSLAILGMGAVVGVNFIFGLAGGDLKLFCTSIFLPSAFIAIYLPIYYYVKKGLYVKLWK